MSVHESVPLPLGQTMCTRVVNILPSETHDFSDIIVCDFSILDVEKGKFLTENFATRHRDLFSEMDQMLHVPPRRTEYWALSYTWGHSPAEHEIKLHGSNFKVRKNLWDFLDRARRDCYQNYIWIDALCINQSTVHERNHQVNMMGAIYSNAARVIVWLGACEGMASTVMREVTVDFPKHGTAGLDRLSPQQIQWILAFYDNPYWSRAWIVQEYLLAKSIDIWFGRFQIRPEILSQLFLTSERDNLSGEIWKSTAMKILRLRSTGVLVQDDSQLIRHQTFLTLVKTFGPDLKCADPRDRVYALLSLLKRKERQELGIHPDYSKSPSELYASILGKIKDSGMRYTNEQDPLIRQLQSMLNPKTNDRDVQLATLDRCSMY